MKNTIYYLKNISGFFSFCSYLLFYPLESQPFFMSRELKCQETNSYLIKSGYFVNEKDYLKNKPTEFVENLEKNFKTFQVFYDLNNNIGTLNGSSLMVMVGNIGKTENVNVKTLVNADQTEFKEITEVKNSLVPVTLFSSTDILENMEGEETGFLKKNFVKKLSFFEKKNFFTIEDAYSSSPKFNFMKIYSQSNEDIKKSSLDFEHFIEFSKGVCKSI